MRGTVEGLASPYSFGELLPAVYQEDGFAMRMMSAFDEVLAPVVSSLDNIEHYFEAQLAPSDFLEMLAWWVGVELDETWSDAARRALVSEAVALYRVRGTVAGMKRHVEIYAGVEPEIEESGACSWSEQPGSPLPGSRLPSLVVRVRVADPDAVDATRLARIVAASKPAHVPHRVEVLKSGEPEPGGAAEAGTAGLAPEDGAADAGTAGLAPEDGAAEAGTAGPAPEAGAAAEAGTAGPAPEDGGAEAGGAGGGHAAGGSAGEEPWAGER